MEQQTGSKSGKEYVKAVYCYPAYLTYLQSTSCEMPGWMNHKLELRLQGKISTISDMQMITLIIEIEAKLNTSQEGEKDNEKAGLKLNIQKVKIMACNPIMANRWGKSRSSDRFYFLGL